MKAAEKGHLAVVKFLVHSHANLNIQDNVSCLDTKTISDQYHVQFGNTAAIDACTNSFKAIVEFLDQKGANLNIKNKVSLTPQLVLGLISILQLGKNAKSLHWPSSEMQPEETKASKDTSKEQAAEPVQEVADKSKETDDTAIEVAKQ